MKTVDELMREIFERPRDPRSDEYKAGVRAVLDWRINAIPVKCPFAALVQQDAFYAGCQEGHRRASDARFPYRSKLI